MAELWLWNSRCRYSTWRLNWPTEPQDTAVAATFESAMRNANINDTCDTLYRDGLGIGPQVVGTICQHSWLPATLPCTVRAGSISRALCCCESIAGQCQQALASNGCSVTTTTTTATWHIKGEIESCWTPGAYGTYNWKRIQSLDLMHVSKSANSVECTVLRFAWDLMCFLKYSTLVHESKTKVDKKSVSSLVVYAHVRQTLSQEVLQFFLLHVHNWIILDFYSWALDACVYWYLKPFVALDMFALKKHEEGLIVLNLVYHWMGWRMLTLHDATEYSEYSGEPGIKISTIFCMSSFLIITHITSCSIYFMMHVRK